LKRLTLSFDNGPTPGITPAVLDLLAERGLKASFFVWGKHAADPARRPLLERIRTAGHRIGNHTYTHTVQLGKSDDPGMPEREIGRAQAALGEYGEPERLFRPSGGGTLGPQLLSTAAVRFLCEGRYTCVLWNSVPRDWDDPHGWPARALDDLRRKDWTLAVLHDIPGASLEALPGFLDAVAAEGVAVVPEFPPECVPIERGKVVRSLDGLVSDAR
jgi:peptidoglycan/xylan/chitin deacetylase (PgdA/CDA1 family)